MDFHLANVESAMYLTRQDLKDAGLPVKSCVISAHGNPDAIYYEFPPAAPPPEFAGRFLPPTQRSDLAGPHVTPLGALVKLIIDKCEPDEPVVLIACETGRPKNDGTVPVAQLLADELKNSCRQETTVWAPTNYAVPNDTTRSPSIFQYRTVYRHSNSDFWVTPEFIAYRAR